MTETGQIIKRYRRTHDWDYARGASLFITISTSPRRTLFGKVEGQEVELSELGVIVRQAIDSIGELNPGVRVHERVVMPDHVHFNVWLEPGQIEPLKVLGKAISRFKNYTTKQAKLLGLVERSSTITTAAGHDGSVAREVAASSGSPVVQGGAASDDGRAVPGQLWQQGYHDRLCLTRQFIDATARYIAYNPLKWSLMYGAQRGALAVHEPLESPRLDSAEYWKGVGNVSLLAEGEKLVSVRISREVRQEAQLAQIVRRIDAAVAQGYVILSGFVSPGEKIVRDRLCDNRGARFIRILPSSLPNARYKPDSRYVEAFEEGRYLEIAKGNEEIEFGRAACLDYNAEIVKMALAGDGFALYWKEDGLHRLVE